jgi:hypothetical protein
MTVGDTAIPLTVVGIGAMLGHLLGGRIANGLLASSNQLGMAGGASVGGIILGEPIGNGQHRSLLSWFNKLGFS